MCQKKTKQRKRRTRAPVSNSLPFIADNSVKLVLAISIRNTETKKKAHVDLEQEPSYRLNIVN